MSDINDLPSLEELERAKKQNEQQYPNINAVDEEERTSYKSTDAAPVLQTVMATTESYKKPTGDVTAGGTDAGAAPLVERTSKGETLKETYDSVETNMPKTIQEKKYTSFELKDEINAARYDVVGMGNVKGKRKKYVDEEGNRINKHTEYMDSIVSTIKVVEEDLNKKIFSENSKQFIEVIYLNYKRIPGYVDSYLSSHKRTWTKEGEARKKIVRMIKESVEREMALFEDEKVQAAVQAYLKANDGNATYMDALSAASANKIGEIKPAQIVRTKKQEDEVDLPTEEQIEAAKQQNQESSETTETRESAETRENTETKVVQEEKKKEEELDLPTEEEIEKEKLKNMETPGYGHIETLDGKIFHDADRMPKNFDTPSFFIQQSIDEDKIMIAELEKKVKERKAQAEKDYNLKVSDGYMNDNSEYRQWYIDDRTLRHRRGVLEKKEEFLEAAKEMEERGYGKAAMELFAKNHSSVEDFLLGMRRYDAGDDHKRVLKKEFKDSKLNSMTVDHNERTDYDMFLFDQERQKRGFGGGTGSYMRFNARLTRGYGKGYLLDISDKENFDEVFDKESYQKELESDKRIDDFKREYYDYSEGDYFTLFKALKEIGKKCERAKNIKDICKLEGAKELSKNKLASSIMAHYMGIENLVEKTTLSEIVLDGKKEIRITTEAKKQSSVNEEIRKVDNLGLAFRYSVSGIKDAMTLKVFSLITGNVSHQQYSKLNNPLLGDFEKKEDGTLEMTNIKAYNNEYSFGKLKITSDAEIERELPALDEEVANNILGMSSDFLDYFFKGTLEKDAIKACKERLKVVKRVIRKWQGKDKSRIITSPEGWEKVRDDFEEGKISSDILDSRLKKGRPVGHGKMYGDDIV